MATITFDDNWIRGTGKQARGGARKANPNPLPSSTTSPAARARNLYTKKLGFTPKDMPEFRSENKPKGIVGKAFDLIDRGRSGIANMMLSEINTDLAARKSGKWTTPSFQAGRFARLNPAVMAIRGFDDFVEGARGETNITGRSIVSRIYDDPVVRRDLGATSREIVDNNLFRSGAGFALDVVADPTNVIPIGVAAKPIKAASKALGITDNIAKPLAKGVSELPIVKKVGKAVGAGRDVKHLSNISEMDTLKAMDSELGSMVGKMLQAPLTKKELTATKATIRGIVSRLDSPKEAERVVKSFNERYKLAQQSIKTLKKQGKEINQKKLFEYMSGVIPSAKNPDKDYLNLAKLGRVTSEEIISPQLNKAKLVADDVLQEGQDTYMRKIYRSQDGKVTQEPLLISKSGGRGLGAEKGILEESKSDALRAVEHIIMSDDKSLKPIAKEFKKAMKQYDPQDIYAQNEVARGLLPKIQALLGDSEGYRGLALERRRAVGLIDDADIIASIGTEQGLNLLATERFFTQTAEFAKDFADEASMIAEGFKRIPDTAKYGSLAGRAVPDVVYDDVVGIIDPSNKGWRTVINAWKQLKLFSPLQFASVARNQIGDMIMNSLVPDGPSIMRQLTLLPKVVEDYQTGGKLFKELTERGVFASTFDNQEMRSALFEKLGKTGDATLAKNIGRVADKFTGKGFYSGIPGVGFGKDAYGATSDINKMVQIQHQLNKGKSLDEAIKMATKATFDYTKLPPALKKYRDNFMPFMTYKYFATQLMIDTAVNRTGKLTKLTHTRRAVEGLTADQANDRDLPDYIRNNRNFHIRTPFKDSQDNPRYLDLSYIYPMGDTANTNMSDIALGNPFVRTATEFAFNKDLFFDKPIFEETNTPSENAKIAAFYLLSQFGPNAPYMPDKQGNIQMVDALKGRENSQGNTPQLPYEIAARFGGVRLREINPKQQRVYNNYATKEQQGEIQGRIRKIRRNTNISEEDKAKRIEKERQKLRDLK